MISYRELMAIRCPTNEFAWSDRDAMLYALAIGMGDDPLDPAALRYLYEADLQVAPSFATVAAWGSNPSIHAARVDYSKVVHAAQSIELHRPLPAAARVRAEGGMISALDKGDKGALIEAETTLCDAATGQPYVTNRITWFARADGHFGGPTAGGPTTGGGLPHAVPQRAPDRTIDYSTRRDQAALFRLLGDRNPLHIDPQLARQAGFARPILHGLCTFGMTCRAVLQSYADMAPAALASHAVRFSAPVFPGETIAIDLWRDGDIVSFEARVPARGVTVIRNGLARLR